MLLPDASALPETSATENDSSSSYTWSDTQGQWVLNTPLLSDGAAAADSAT
jgi:hypothetical protein